MVATLVRAVRDSGVIAPASISRETPGLAHGAQRPADILLRDFDGLGRHVAMDVGITSPFSNSALSAGSHQRPGSTASAYEQNKIRAVLGVGAALHRTWRFIPFIIEDGGRLGAHAAAFLSELARRQRGPATTSSGLRISVRLLLYQRLSSVVHHAAACAALFPAGI